MKKLLLIALAAFGANVSTPALAQEPTAQEIARFERITRRTPLIDGHNDLPWAIRDDHGNDLSRVDLNSDTSTLTPPLHTDIARLRAGGVARNSGQSTCPPRCVAPSPPAR